MGNAVIETSGSAKQAKIKPAESWLSDESHEAMAFVRQELSERKVWGSDFDPRELPVPSSIQFERGGSQFEAELCFNTDKCMWKAHEDGRGRRIVGYVAKSDTFRVRTRVIFWPDGCISYWSSALAS